MLCGLEGAGKGFWEAGGGFLGGLKDLVTNPGATLEGLKNVAEAVRDCASCVAEAIGNAIQQYDREYNQADDFHKNEMDARLAGNIVLALAGTKGLGSASKLSKLGRLGGAARVLYRVDTRAPGEIFTTGFEPKGANMDLLQHVAHNPADSGFVSTTKSLQAANDIQNETGAGHIYKLRGDGIDVNETLGGQSPFPWEQEAAIPGDVPSCDIAGCWGEGGNWTSYPGFREWRRRE